jgi:hypothetical protein
MHVTRSGSIRLPAARERVFPFFTAEGERMWVPGWQPQYLHPDHPSNDAGTVFRTNHGGEETLWLVIRHEPDQGIATYGRFTPNSRLGTVHVECVDVSPSETRVTVTYQLTALTEAGAKVLQAMTVEAYSAMLDEWRDVILAKLDAPPPETSG